MGPNPSASSLAPAAFRSDASLAHNYDLDIARSSHAIGVLGRFSGDWHAILPTPTPALSMPADLPRSLPSAVIPQRPDLRANERRLAAATAQIGVAQAERFPTFRITLGFGTTASVIHDLFRRCATWKTP